MQGCDNFCAYCIVPYVRGRQRSRSPDAVLEECRALLRGGARELTLLGQNVNAYGHDDPARKMRFAELLHAVAALPGLERLRFVTPHPKDLGQDVIDAFAALPVLAPRLHLPLQSGSDRILKLMGRRYTTEQFRSLVGRLREARPGMHLSTDVIVGFPGETEEDFAGTMAFMREMAFVGSFSFAYSDRPGTEAAALAGKLDKKTKLERLAELQNWQYDFGWQRLKELVGRECLALLEEPALREGGNGEFWLGREERGHGVTVRLTRQAPARGWRGALVPAKITRAGMHALEAEQCGEAS
jgi:tRNA-2-methylthio-N6-dimethylallyladenosine synthase